MKRFSLELCVYPFGTFVGLRINPMACNQTMTEQETPEGWSWGIGESSNHYYDYWAYHNHYELHMYWDGYDEHYVEVFEYSSVPDEDDRRIGENSISTVVCETQEEAEETAIFLMEEYN